MDDERMKEVTFTLNTKGGSLTVVTPQFGFQDTVLRTWDWMSGMNQETSTYMEIQDG